MTVSDQTFMDPKTSFPSGPGDQTFLEPKGSHQTDPFELQDISADGSGLTSEEQAIMDHLLLAWNCYVNLPVQHPADQQEFMRSFHELQRLLAVRITRRQYPAFWRSGEPIEVR
jgi:hypothetical protein